MAAVGYGDKKEYETSQKSVKSGSDYKYVPETIEDVLEYPVVGIPERGLTKSTCNHYGIRCKLNELDEVERIYFPYHKEKGAIGSGEFYISGFKCKDLTKTKKVPKGERSYHFTTVGDVDEDCLLFGIAQAKSFSSNRVVITEGECFHPDTEVLTKGGWVSFSDYDGQEVMQVDDQLIGSFTNPLAVVDKGFSGNLIHYKSGSYETLVTPDHDMVRLHKTNGVIKTKASGVDNKHLPIPRVVHYNTYDQGISDLDTQILVMISADFTLREGGDIYGVFSKERKIDRCKYLLDRKGVRYSSNTEKNGKTNFFIHRGHGLYSTKLFDWSVISNCNLQVFLDELIYWDGNSVPNRLQFEYSSKYLHNSTIVQTVAHLCGYVSTIIPRSNELGSWYKVSVLLNKETSSIQKGYKEVPYDGRVMCLTVPTGMLLVRYKGSISVSGNCDAGSFWESCVKFYKRTKDLEKAKNLIILSIGFGTASAVKHISSERNQYYLDRVEKKVLCFDNDEATDEELSRGIKKGKEAIKAVISCYPSYFVANTRYELNDPNDMHLAGRHDELFWSMMKPDTYTSDSFVDVSKYQDQLIMIPTLGRLWPWESMNRLTMGKQDGAGHYLGSGVGQGKTEFLNKLIDYGIQANEPPFAVFKFEEKPEVTLRKQMGMANGFKFHDPSKVIYPGNVDVWGDPIPPGARGFFTEEDLFNAKCEFDEDSVIIYNTEHFPEWEQIKADIRYATVVRGSRDIILDPLTSLFEGIEAGEANRLLAEIARDLYLMANDIGFNFYVTCHLNAPKFGPPHEEGGKVLANQFTGSKAMMRAAVGQWGLERNRREDLPEIIRNMSWLNCLKDRVYGRTGGFHLWYDKDTGSYDEPSKDLLEEYKYAIEDVKQENRKGSRAKSPADFPVENDDWVDKVKGAQ